MQPALFLFPSQTDSSTNDVEDLPRAPVGDSESKISARGLEILQVLDEVFNELPREALAEAGDRCAPGT